MSPKVAVTVIVIALLLGLGAWWQWGPSGDASDSGAHDDGSSTTEVIDDASLVPATLYWLGLDARLHGVVRQLPPGDATARVTSIVTALLQEPESDVLGPLPVGTELASVFFMNPTTVALDFILPPDVDLGRVGSTQELLSLYSVVNSVVMNVDEVASVVILIGGQQPKTLAGHVDTTHPLAADLSLIAG